MTSSRDRDRTLVVGRVGAVSGIMREQVGHGLVLMLCACILYFLYTVYKNYLIYRNKITIPVKYEKILG